MQNYDDLRVYGLCAVLAAPFLVDLARESYNFIKKVNRKIERAVNCMDDIEHMIQD